MEFAEFRKVEFERRDQQLRNSRPMKLKKPEEGENGKEFLHIVYVMTWTGICGGSKIIFEHCNRLAERGHQVTIVCHLPKPEWFPLDERVRFLQPAFGEVLCEYIPPCDVIVATYWREIYECVQQKIAPVVYFEQGDIHLFDPGTMDKDTMRHISRQIQLAPFVFTVSGFAAEKIADCFGMKAEVIPNAVDKTIFYPAPEGKSAGEKKVIVAIGPDYLPFKGISDILASIKELRKKEYEIEFIWITPGTPSAGVTEPAVVNPPQSIIGDYLRRADIYVCASLYDSFNLPVLEAMTCGAAVVTTDCGGVREYVVDGKNALLIEKNHVSHMTEKLELLLQDEELRNRLGEEGLRTAEQFSWDRTVDQLVEYYREIAGYQIMPEEEEREAAMAKQDLRGNTVSLCMIVKNEEKVLARCLDSIREAVDEIIIVDTGSDDQTKSIAASYTDQVYDFEWINDFSAARNFAFSKATMDYMMWLDADDVLTKEERLKMIKLKKELDPQTDIVTMKYITHFDGQGNPIHYSTRERFIRRGKGYEWQGPVHECIPLIGHVVNSDITVQHRKVEVRKEDQGRNLKIYEALEKEGKPFDPRQQYYYARELRDHGIWIKSAYYFEKFLDEKRGWVEDNIASCFALSAIYKTMGDREKVLPILFRSFTYAPPRGEICCEIGYFYKEKGDFASALQWFQIAAAMEPPQSKGFVFVDYYGYIPCIESCVCSYEMGDFASAQKHNEAAALFKPDSPAVEINRNALKGKVRS